MDRKKTIHALSILGDTMLLLAKNADKEAYNPLVATDYYEKMQTAILGAKAQNGWFSEDAIRESLQQIGERLNEEELGEWVNAYEVAKKPKSVGLILAGNIPMVGFHDVLSTLISGHKAHIKLSRDDKVLIPVFLDILKTLQPELTEQIQIVDNLKKVDAVIATGSDNTARYFEKYFGHLPRIIRKNRTSVAVITGEESKNELKALGKDIFTYFGLGCRNVSHLILPKNYNLDLIFEAIIDYSDVINHNKYANNYDYYKAIFLLNLQPILENGFLLTREIEDLHAPVSVLHYHFYSSKDEVDAYLNLHAEKIQAVIGKDYLPFGAAQSPALDDYADGVNTLKFLSEL
ncbi:acyl-CoA reductase [Brumimicrobium salinarum]|nr:acyl-CoA reductase [Brumimicrobium salinarum]